MSCVRELYNVHTLNMRKARYCMHKVCSEWLSAGELSDMWNDIKQIVKVKRRHNAVDRWREKVKE